jgi:hypothetical protein
MPDVASHGLVEHGIGTPCSIPEVASMLMTGSGPIDAEWAFTRTATAECG